MNDFLDDEISMAEGSLEARQQDVKRDRLNNLWDQIDDYGDGLGLEGWIFE